jgi:hypothetical protein
VLFSSCQRFREGRIQGAANRMPAQLP